MSPLELKERATFKKWFRQGPKASLEDVPYPERDGKKLPHGAILDDAVPIQLHTRRAVIWWLRLRNCPPSPAYTYTHARALPPCIHTHVREKERDHTHRPKYTHDRHVNVPGNYPWQGFLNEHGGKEPGLIDLVKRTRQAGENAPCMTQEEVRLLEGDK